MEMLVTQGLNELKLLDDRINREISNAKFVSCSKKGDSNVDGIKSKVKFKIDAKASLDSIRDLSIRRNKIKSAIVASNAVTKVCIADIEYTVAEAIERKSSVIYEQNLLRVLKTQYSASIVKITRENEKVDADVKNLLNTAYGKDSKDKVTTDMYDLIAVPFKEKNEYELVDSFDIDSTIKSLENSIESFLSEVDTALQVSNSITKIEI